jgi:hypothetical protein
MGWFVTDERVPLEGLECRCAGTPHPDGDTVWLRSELPPDGGFAALRLIGGDPDTLSEKIGRVYLQYGVVDWTFLDDDGKPVPCTPETIARLSWDAAFPIAEKADDVYQESLLRPLVVKASRSSRNGHTAASTSRSSRASRTAKAR